ncbi:MAG: hypothetical protein L6284_03670, partial [Brevundimonas sp.]|nr:hypothetical protein [Brevundimonas sp.]
MPNTPVLKFGVAGVGVMGRNHARVASEMREFDLTTVFDPDAVVADGVAGAAGAAAGAPPPRRPPRAGGAAGGAPPAAAPPPVTTAQAFIDAGL